MNKKDLLIIRQVIEVCDRLTDEEIQMAWECIDKQIPKKSERLDAFKSIGKCGGCESVISPRTASVYCQYCGQKIDWEESP